ncbi:MAG: hypothetical protein E3J64_08250 [Anaerolineales bacterium]|nr:MAG: hypothetical protein E3J64_08250 [Anaerolineales bacterium]
MLLLALLMIGATACNSSLVNGTDGQATLRLVAADSCAVLVERLAEAYQRDRPQVVIEIEVFNSAVAERRLSDGQADLALLSRVGEGSDTGDLWLQEFASHGVALITNPSLPFDDAGLAELREIFWAQLLELDGQLLLPVTREDGSGVRAFFDSVVLGHNGVAPNAVVMPSNRLVVEYVAQTPGAVGYVSTLVLGDPTEWGVHVVAVEGVLPSAAAVADGSYPLANRLRIATVGEPRGEAREFAQWLLGPCGQEIVWSR